MVCVVPTGHTMALALMTVLLSRGMIISQSTSATFNARHQVLDWDFCLL